VAPLVLAADVPVPAVLALMALGILIAIAGHVVASYRVVGLGLALVFLATALMVLGGFSAYEGRDR
jgi:hypothetical protein